jgi:hypothetical protein
MNIFISEHFVILHDIGSMTFEHAGSNLCSLIHGISRSWIWESSPLGVAQCTITSRKVVISATQPLGHTSASELLYISFQERLVASRYALLHKAFTLKPVPPNDRR